MTRIRIATLLLLASCAAPNIQPQLKTASSASVGLSTAPSPAIAADWWTALGDPQLDRIMADALAGNPTLDAAMARVRLAEAQVGGAKAQQQPQIAIDGQETFSRLSDKYIIPPPYAGTWRWTGTAQAGLNWNLDFWGRQKAMIAQAQSSARAADLDAAAARLALSGAVAQTYVSLVHAEQLVAIAHDFVSSREQSLSLVRTRIRNKLASDFDLRAAETLLAQARQAEVRAFGARDQAVHALAALAGRGADYYPTILKATLRLDSALPLPSELPADLLARRPDLLAALARIDAAAGGRQVARTAYYPNVNLLGLAGLQALGLGNLVSTGAATYGGGAAIHIPIFEGGKLKADLTAATATLDVATADYNTAVLRAVRETADAISAIRTDAADAEEQNRILLGLQDTVRLDRSRVAAGLGSQLDILDSGTRLLAAQQSAADLAAASATARVQLLIAVGGGFTPPPTQTAQITPAQEAKP